MVLYSFSQLSLYQQCPKKYQFRYLDKIERDFETTPDLVLGTSVHSALEWLYQQVSIFLTPELSDVIWKFEENRTTAESQAKNELNYHKELQKTDYLRRGENYLRTYYQKYYPFDQSKLIATEKRLIFNLDDPKGEKESIKFTGFIDRLDKEDDTFIINDYKTNKHLPSAEDTDYQEQLTLYAKAMQQLYPDYQKNIKARLHFLHFDLLKEWEIWAPELAVVENKYYQLASEIEEKRFYFNMGERNTFPTKENNYCKYCEYMSICPLWIHLGQGDEMISHQDLGESSVKRLVDRYAELGKQETESKKEKEIIKEVLIGYQQGKQQERLFGYHNSIKFSRQSSWKTIDKDGLKEYLVKIWLLDEASDLSHHKILALIKKWEISLWEVGKFWTLNENQSLYPRKLKEDEIDFETDENAGS